MRSINGIRLATVLAATTLMVAACANRSDTNNPQPAKVPVSHLASGPANGQGAGGISDYNISLDGKTVHTADLDTLPDPTGTEAEILFLTTAINKAIFKYNGESKSAELYKDDENVLSISSDSTGKVDFSKNKLPMKISAFDVIPNYMSETGGSDQPSDLTALVFTLNPTTEVDEDSEPSNQPQQQINLRVMLLVKPGTINVTKQEPTSPVPPKDKSKKK